MNTRFFTFLLLFFGFVESYSQVTKKPSMMILPSDNWCTERYFIQEYDNQGLLTKMSDFERAFKEDPELPSVISVVGGFLAGRGYAIKDAEQSSRYLKTTIAEQNAIMSKNGIPLSESALSVITSRVKSDILIQVSWSYINYSQDPMIQYSIEAFDCYSGFRIPATITGSRKGDVSIVSLLQKEIPTKLNEFDKGLTKYFAEVNTKGREISIDIRRWADWDKDFDSEINGISLTDYIEKWMEDNTVESSFNLLDSDEENLRYEQVRIPVFNKHNTAMDARTFASDLKQYLKNKLNIQSKVVSFGLSKAIIIVGDNN